MKKVKHLLHRKIVSPLAYFIRDSRSVGVILLLCTVLSILLSNSSFGEAYRGIWTREWMHGGSLSAILPGNSLGWINNFLMAFFFFMAGMEIKRELTVGEMASVKKAILPFGAALGGMVVPALIYFFLNRNDHTVVGWGIPTATDIAFSLGVASLLGNRVPIGLKIFLMALAIIDDLGAIIVVALFYGGKISTMWLLASAILYGSLFLLNKLKVRFGPIQFLIGILLWFSMYQAGIEAGITGVLFAFAVPANQLAREEKIIHGWVNYLILPLFALANTAILLPVAFKPALYSSVSMGILAGLVIGKPLGIYFFSRILVGLRIAQLPNHVKWNQFLGMGTLAGIGFTMSIFTTTLAFSDAETTDIAKIAIMVAMLTSLVLSWVYFAAISFKPRRISITSAGEPEVIFNISMSQHADSSIGQTAAI